MTRLLPEKQAFFAALRNVSFHLSNVS